MLPVAGRAYVRQRTDGRVLACSNPVAEHQQYKTVDLTTRAASGVKSTDFDISGTQQMDRAIQMPAGSTGEWLLARDDNAAV